MLRIFKKLKREQKPNFNIIEDRRGGTLLMSIKCNQCGHTSYSAADVKYKYCGHCKMFHT